MELEVGYVYHIKNEYFEVVKDDKLMKNHEGNATRPNYLCIKKEDSDILWFVPMSSQIDKYEKIKEKIVEKYGKCNTIVIGKYRNRETAFLIQNMFPVIEKYIDHIDTVQGRTQAIAKSIQIEIAENITTIFKLKKRGIKLIFPDVDKIEQILLNELHKK